MTESTSVAAVGLAGVRGLEGAGRSQDYRGVAVAMDMFVVLTVSRVCK